MTIESHGHEHEFEPQYGLPERLPAGENILWQGAPDPKVLAIRVFHLRKLAIYFALMLAWRAGTALSSGGSLVEALVSIQLLAPLALAGLASIALLAWLTARTTAYTLTDKRVVMRIGIVLTVTFNLPLRTIAAAGLSRKENGFGDITLALAGEDRIAWLHLWPHVRPWRLTKPEPMLRAVPDAQSVAALLAKAWSEVTGVTPNAAPTAAAPGEPQTATQLWQPSPTT
jgi:Bacterial PH domain